MKQKTILIIAIALAAGGVVVYASVNKHEHSMNGMDHSVMQSGVNDGRSMPMGTMDHSAMMVGSEREFVTGMIPHHQEAVDTAKEVLARGGSTEEIRTLASEIIAAQETEIAMLTDWHLAWYGEAYVADSTYVPMMRDLSQLSGSELDKQFLEDMIPHHMGAIMMAQSVRPYIEHQEVSNMADTILETQTAEIELMRDLLTAL